MHGAKPVMTGIFKSSSAETHRLGKSGLSGDGQADLVHHGGPDKAVCVYFERHYPYWESVLQTTLPFGAFGENWTLSEWSEQQLCIGDCFKAGDVMVQISQPRQPCYKIGLRHERPELTAQVVQTGYTGFYFRVLTEGDVAAGTHLELTRRDPSGVTITEANRIMHTDKMDIDGMQALLAVDALSASWKETIATRLSKLLQEERPSGGDRSGGVTF
ncbi:MOSC domain-containing protein [Paenibacillus sp. NPDC058071]|uniref:MOSC domain-containing protein n=1 Tax=Paenibacillus sp. NPDC058071 TaxID=3346326 RepID=UPI0036DA39B6